MVYPIGPDRFALNVSFGSIVLSSFTSIVTGFVSSLEKINEFLGNRGDILSEKYAKKIVDSLKWRVSS